MSIYRIGQTITYTNIITRKFVRLYDRDTTDMNVPQTNKVIQVSSEGWQICLQNNFLLHTPYYISDQTTNDNSK